jgi:hypothetical protein
MTDPRPLLSEIARLKAELAAAEEAMRKALVAIPIAMDAAVVREREACAKIAEGFDRNRDWVPGSLYDTLRREVAAAIRSTRATEKTDG